LASIAGDTDKGYSQLVFLIYLYSFLVADQVYVSSVIAKTPDNPNPTQHVFSSNSDDSAFEIFPDPRGNSLGRGTEITLILKDDSFEYLDNEVLAQLV
jgi:heat shock protein 90kDa beta